MYAILGFIIFYIVPLKILKFFRKNIFEGIQEEIKRKLAEDEQIICAGWFWNFGVNFICFLCGIAGMCIMETKISEMKAIGFILLLLMLFMFCIIINSQFKNVIFLTNKSLFYIRGYVYHSQIESIAIKDIKTINSDDFIYPRLEITFKNNRQQFITHIQNSKQISKEIENLIKETN